MIMTINAFFYFIMGGAFHSTYNDGFNWLPASLRTGTGTIDSGSQVNPMGFEEGDINSSIEVTGAASIKSIIRAGSFISALNFVYDLGFNIMFGYFVWLQLLLPFPLVVALSVPLFFIQMWGLFYLLQGFVSALGMAIGLIRGG
jgi:hypothetical protein